MQIIGGSSGIGLAAARIFASKGAQVHVLDVTPIDLEFDIFANHGQTVDDDANDLPALPSGSELTFHLCDVTDWVQLRDTFLAIGRVDIVVANAGVSQDPGYFEDITDASGLLTEPAHRVVDVNIRSVLNLTKLALRQFAKQPPGGGIVITASATAYAPEQSLPVYSATKHAVSEVKVHCDDNMLMRRQLVGLIRGLRPSIVKQYGATINGVAPAATISKLLPGDLAAPIIAAGAPVSSAYHVGLAVVFSAVATQSRMVEAYGNDDIRDVTSSGRWNGRVIMTLGDRWTELEEPIATLRPQWFGAYNTELTAFQQKLTDTRPR